MDQKSIAELKASIDLVQYIQSRGIQLKKSGKEFLGLCPLHEDHTPSFSVSPEKQLWKCFGCNKGGDVITFVQELDKISFNEAVGKLSGAAVPASDRNSGASRLQLLSRVFEFYARTYESDARGYQYLKSRGIKSPALFKRFRFGFCNGSMLKTLSSQLKKELTEIGVLSNGKEFFHECVVFPLVDSNGQIVNLYGRHVTKKEHKFLAGEQRGLFYPPKGASSLILTEGIIDALTLHEAGYTNVLPIYGVNGLTEDHLTFIKQERVMQLTLCLDGDDAGRAAAPILAEKLKSTGATVTAVQMPKDMDVNEFFAKHDGAAFSALLEASERKDEKKSGPKEAVIEGPTGASGYIFSFDNHTYRVLDMNLVGLSKLKINLKVSMNADSSKFHIDTLDLYLDRARERFVQIASERFGVEQSEITQELYALIDVLENKRLELIRGDEKETSNEMTDQERTEALTFLQSKDLIDLIQKDFDLCGYIGEETSRLFGYLAQTSRFLKYPLGVLIVSRSGAGKSQLQDMIGKFVPDESLHKYTRISGQSLFYQQDGNLKYSVLSIAEEKGAEDAIYSIRTLQSDQYLTVAVTTTDPKTGIKRTEEYHVEGPVVIIITTTNPEALDFETRNRFVILTIDESREQTKRILQKQRERQSLEGLLRSRSEEGVFRKHKNAQRLLRKDIFVINPFFKDLTYPEDKLLMRREQNKYLTLIETIAFLHQYQREVKKIQTASGEVDYIEVTIDDIALANKLAAEVLGRSLDELSPHTRNLLKSIKAMVDTLAKEQKNASTGLSTRKPEEVTFTRRDIREHCGWSIFQVQEHIRQLVDQEYLLMKNGEHNRFLYGLLWDGQGEDGQKFVSGLIDVEELKKRRNGKK